MATVRIFLPTFRRPQLLPRAVESLQAQTFQDWVCEVHNDDPADDSPKNLLAKLADERFQLAQHPRNLGGTAAFNQFFHPTPESFYSILEDDNWWEPEFLASMLATAGTFPDATIFWANMRLWEEMADGRFRDTGRTVRPEKSGEPAPVFWGGQDQVFGALHSQSALLVRSRPGQHFSTPGIPIAAVEIFRERSFPHPMIFVPRPLANFSITCQTARSQDREEWAMLQTLLAASFLKHAPLTDSEWADLWQFVRRQQPPKTTALLLASWWIPKLRSRRKHARLADWLLLARGFCRNPGMFLRILRSRHTHPDWWEWLDRHTALRFRENGASPP